MKRTLVMLFLACMAGKAVARAQMVDQLRKAIVEEEASQNLDKAIADYNDILKQYDEHRITAATALFHLADCYRKKGNDEKAIDAYKRIIGEFPEQTALSDAIRNYLASVHGIRSQQITEAEMAEIEAAEQKLEIIRKQIDRTERQIKETEKRVESGVASPSEIYPLGKELLSLQERLADMQYQMKIHGMQN